MDSKEALPRWAAWMLFVAGLVMMGATGFDLLSGNLSGWHVARLAFEFVVGVGMALAGARTLRR